MVKAVPGARGESRGTALPGVHPPNFSLQVKLSRITGSAAKPPIHTEMAGGRNPPISSPPSSPLLTFHFLRRRPVGAAPQMALALQQASLRLLLEPGYPILQGPKEVRAEHACVDAQPVSSPSPSPRGAFRLSPCSPSLPSPGGG